MQRDRIFVVSCLALAVTSLTFAIRAGILTELSRSFGLSDRELGLVNMMAFLGFPVATMIGGPLYNYLGPKKILTVAFVSHMLGLLLTIFAGGFWGLLVSTFFIGFANGSVEAACNPLIVQLYPEKKTTMLNKFHVWFPGGIVIGSLIVLACNKMGIGWQGQIATMLIPALVYGFMTFGLSFPSTEEASSGGKLNSLFPPIYLIIIGLFVLVGASDLTIGQMIDDASKLKMVKYILLIAVAVLVYYRFGLVYAMLALCMSLTATTELGTQQWVERILGNAGASPMLVLLLVTGLMAAGRYFGGPVIHRLKPIGVLLVSAIIATIGLALMSQATGLLVYLAAILFAIGVMYFWPTMLGAVAEYTPKTGALGLSFLGGVGMFATGLWQPVIGSWIDAERQAQLASGLDVAGAELAAGQAALDNLAVFPAVLIVLFSILFVMQKRAIS